LHELAAAGLVGECDGDERLVAGRAVGGVPDVGHDDALVRFQLAIDAAEPKVATVG